MNKEETFARPSLHHREDERIKDLLSVEVLDTESEEAFDSITGLIGELFNLPIVLISLVDKERQWFKSACGLSVNQTDRDISFCGHAIVSNSEYFIIEDTQKDSRFKCNPLVLSKPHIRFYAGFILYGPKSLPIGTLCLIDSKPRTLEKKQILQIDKFRKLVQKLLLSRVTTSSNEVEKLSTSVAGMSELGRFYYNELTKSVSSNVYIISVEIDNTSHLLMNFGVNQVNKLLEKIVLFLQNRIDLPCMFGILDGKTITGVINLKENQQSKTSITKLIHRWQRALKKELYNNIIVLSTIYITKSNSKQPDFHSNLVNLELLKDVTPKDKRIAFFTNNIREKLKRRELLEKKLTVAIKEKMLTVAFQPKILIENQKQQIYGAELLLRWHDPELGQVSPAEFIDVAEHTGLIHKLGYYLIESVEEYDKMLTEKGVKNKLTLAINISPVQLLDNFVFIIHLIDKNSSLNNIKLCVEITESLYVEEFELIEKLYTLLKRNKIMLSIDDFGTGYSSLQYISSQKFNEIKIDRHFVDGIQKKGNKQLLKTTYYLANSLNMQIVAEGVETKSQLETLLTIGYSRFQGYYFHKPMPFDSFLEILND